MNPAFRFFSLVAMALLAAATTSTSCARQKEGERCDEKKGLGSDSDCTDGLLCTAATKLQQGNVGDLKTSVCCPEDGSFTTIACTPKQPTTAATTTAASSTSGSAGGTSGAAGMGGKGGAAGMGGKGGMAAASGAGGTATAASSSSAGGS